MTIAVIFACFNRKHKTKRCLEYIYRQQIEHNCIKIDVYVTDDGSTDGTKELLKSFAEKMTVYIINGNNLFWNKGMYVAMKKAMEFQYDYYMMINDDVEFYDNFLDVMLESFAEVGIPCGISGPTQDEDHLHTTYGGKMINGKGFIEPNGNIQKCDLANWNCFLVNHTIIDKVGIIDPCYDHSYGDYDYSLAMQRNGFDVYLAKEYVGICDRNSTKGTYKDTTLTRRQRMNIFFSPKGMSIKSLLRYSLKNLDFIGVRGMIFFLCTYIKNLIVVLVG